MTDQVEVEVTYGHIVQTPGVMGGRPRIAGRRIRVMDVYVMQTFHGYSPEEIVEQYTLTPGQVYAALAYAYDHLDEIEAALAHDEAEYERLKAASPPSKVRLLWEARQAERDE